MQGFRMPDPTPIYWLAIVGLATLALLAVGVLGAMIWFAATHLRVV